MNARAWLAERELPKLPSEECRQSGAYGSRHALQLHRHAESCIFAGNTNDTASSYLVKPWFYHLVAVDAVWSELLSDLHFLLTGNFTGNFEIFGLVRT